MEVIINSPPFFGFRKTSHHRKDISIEKRRRKRRRTEEGPKPPKTNHISRAAIARRKVTVLHPPTISPKLRTS